MAKNYTVLHNHIWSLLDSISKSKDVVSRAKELSMLSASITDHDNIVGCIEFWDECNKVGIKPILGCEFSVSDDLACIKDDTNRKARHLIVLAKNYDGWKKLIQLNNFANENYYYKPRIDREAAKNIIGGKDLVGASACIAGVVASKLFKTDDALNYHTKKEVEEALLDNWLEEGIKETMLWVDIFGKGNFFLEIQNEGMPSQIVVMECIREISNKTGIPIIATCDAHFVNKEDAVEHEILICSQTKTTLAKRNELREAGEDILFSDNSGYYIKSYDEMLECGFTEEELENTNKVANMIENYEIKAKEPRLPTFQLPDGINDKEKFFIELCKKGLKRIGKENDQEYKDRANMEFGIFKSVKTSNASLLDYFLIVWDIIEEIRRMGSVTPVGRGSAAGCLCSYLLGITEVDPIKHDLSFQRFYNTGRLSEGRISLPDIDLDCASTIRKDLIQYLKNRYGEENVAQIATYGTLKPKAAIKEVFRAYGIDFSEANKFTKHFPDEELKHDDDASYSIKDALEISEEFRKEAEQYKAQIESAIKLEGVKKNRGVHAAGIIIADQPIKELFPLAWDSKSKSLICALEMGDAEKLGGVKVDLLGMKTLSVFDLCIKKINELKLKPVRYGGNKEEKKDKFYDFVCGYFYKNGYELLEESDGIYIFRQDGRDENVKVFIEPNIENVKEISDRVRQFCEKNKKCFVLTRNGSIVYAARGDKLLTNKSDRIFKFGMIEKDKIVKDDS